MQRLNARLFKPRFAIAWSAVLFLSSVQTAGCPGSRLSAQSAQPAVTLATASNDFLAPYVSSNSFSGAVFVVRDGNALFEQGYGMGNHEANVLVEPHTKFRIASVTKSFTAAAVLLLAERGIVDLDEPVSDYIAEFPHGDRITVRQLLAHESGLPNYYFDLDDFPTLSQQHYESPANVVALAGGIELQFEPGARNAYNNMNYTALAWLIEEQTGLPFREFLSRELLLPLGLEETGYSGDVAELTPNLAMGYEPVGVEGFQKSRYFDHSIFVGAGSMYSTTSDLARWASALVAGDLLQGESLANALEYGWREQEIHSRRAFVASGWDNIGYSAHLIHLPDERLTVVVLCNLNIALVVGEIALGLTAIALSEEPLPTKLAPRTLPADSLQAVAGRYRFGDDFYSPGGVLDLQARDGWLIDVGREPEAALIPLADGGFLYRPVWARVRFTKNAQGSVTGLTFYDRFSAEKEPERR
jgi:D-alanyl-D-alanine carboxypeptidase